MTFVSVVVGDNGEIWAGGSEGLGVYRNGVFLHVGRPKGFTDSGVFFIKRVPGGKFLAGGRDGLFEYDGKAWHAVLHGLDRVRNITPGKMALSGSPPGPVYSGWQGGKQISYGTEEGLPSICRLSRIRG